METWNRLIAVGGEGGVGNGGRKGKGLVKEHVQMMRGHRQWRRD